jgi:trans-aconitate 2-methyltransferase
LPDHQRLTEKLVGFLRPGGVLAVQMPNLMQEFSHAIIRMVAADGPWNRRLLPIAKTRTIIPGPDSYYQWLSACCSSVDVWQTTYIHPLDSIDDIVDWFAGSALQPFLEPLDAGEQQLFLARYRAELADAYKRQPDGKVLLRYPRLFFVARK